MKKVFRFELHFISMHILDLKAYSDSASAFIEDRQVEQSRARNTRSPQTRTRPEVADLSADPQSPDMYKGNFIDIYI